MEKHKDRKIWRLGVTLALGEEQLAWFLEEKEKREIGRKIKRNE